MDTDCNRFTRTPLDDHARDAIGDVQLPTRPAPLDRGAALRGLAANATDVCTTVTSIVSF